MHAPSGAVCGGSRLGRKGPGQPVRRTRDTARLALRSCDEPHAPEHCQLGARCCVEAHRSGQLALFSVACRCGARSTFWSRTERDHGHDRRGGGRGRDPRRLGPEARVASRCSGRLLPGEWRSLRAPRRPTHFAYASTRCPPAPIRMTSPRRATARSGTRPREQASSAGSIRRPERRRRYHSARARRPTASSSGPMAPPG